MKKIYPLSLEPRYQRIYDRMNHFLPAHPRKRVVRNEQRGDSMDARPERLGRQFHVYPLHLSCLDTLADPSRQKGKGLHSRRIRLVILLMVESFRDRHHECRPVLMRVFQPELDIRKEP